MKHKRIAAILAAIFLVLSVLSSCAGGASRVNSSGLGRASDPIPFRDDVRSGVLSSGMRYYILENSRPEGRAFLTLAVDAGSVLETEEERGLAHFVEHMAFNGTARFPKFDLINYLRSLGMRFGPEINAWTSFDETVYGIEVPTEIGPGGFRIVPEMAMAVIDDWSGAITFDPEEVDLERLVVIEEYRFRQGAGERTSREIFPVLFRDSLYAERHPIGLLSVLETATAEQLQGYYERWYRPENMAIIIVGDFDGAYLEASLEQHFPNRAGTHTGTSNGFERPRHDLRRPQRGSLESLIITDDELTRSLVTLYWKRLPGGREQNLITYREGIIDTLISVMLSLRFEEASLRVETPYTGAASGLVNYGYSSGFFALQAVPKTGMVTETVNEMFMLKETLSRYGFTQGEVDTATTGLIAYMEQMVTERDRQHSSLHTNALTRHFLNDRAFPDLEWELDALMRLLPGITLREINRVTAGYFAEDDLTVIVTAPDSEIGNLPSSDDVRMIAASASRARIARPTDERAQGELLSRVPSPGVIVSETTDHETGAVRIRLGNGAEVILLETTHRNNEISFFAQARGGILDVPAEIDISAAFAAEVLNVSGLGSFSRPELTRMLLDRQVSMSFWTQNHLRGFQGSSATNDIQVLFEMLHLFFTQPRYDAQAVNAMLDQARSRLIGQENDPDVFFRREITRVTHGNPRYHPMNVEDLNRFDGNAAMAFAHASLNPSDYTFVFAGNLTPALMRPLIETYLASIPPSSAFNQWANINPMRPAEVDREIRRGREERSTIYEVWYRPLAYSEENAAAVAVLSDYLDIVMIDEIREALGGVYAISSWVSLSPMPTSELSGGIFFVTDPGRIEELSAAAVEEFRKIARGEIDDSVFEKAVEALMQSHEESIQINSFLAQSYANSAVIFNAPLSRLNNRPVLQRAVRHADIQRIAAELLTGSHVRLVLVQEN
ncbi:MAG: insulinase family protein [Treponema sp.]|nr:insulinase family protein [Treponema sp.]